MIQLDVYRDVTEVGGFGWELTDSNDGGMIDSRYGFKTYEAAERAGRRELMVLERDLETDPRHGHNQGGAE